MGRNEIIKACIERPGYRAVVVSPDYMRSNWAQRDMLDRCNRIGRIGAGFAISRSEPALKFSNGSSIQFATMRDAEERRLDSLVIHGANFDGEISERAKELVNYRVNRRDPVCNYTGWKSDWITRDPENMKARLFHYPPPNQLKLEIPRPVFGIALTDAKKGDTVQVAPVDNGYRMSPISVPLVYSKITPEEKTMKKFFLGTPDDPAYFGAYDALKDAVSAGTVKVESGAQQTLIVSKVVKKISRKAPPIVVEDVT